MFLLIRNWKLMKSNYYISTFLIYGYVFIAEFNIQLCEMFCSLMPIKAETIWWQFFFFYKMLVPSKMNTLFPGSSQVKINSTLCPEYSHWYTLSWWCYYAITCFYAVHIYNPSFLAMYLIRSITRILYPNSLSYLKN